MLHPFSDIARYWSQSADLNLPYLYLAPPLGVMSLEFRPDIWHQKTRVPGLPYTILSVILGLARMLISSCINIHSDMLRWSLENWNIEHTNVNPLSSALHKQHYQLNTAKCCGQLDKRTDETLSGTDQIWTTFHPCGYAYVQSDAGCEQTLCATYHVRIV